MFISRKQPYNPRLQRRQANAVNNLSRTTSSSLLKLKKEVNFYLDLTRCGHLQWMGSNDDHEGLSPTLFCQVWATSAPSPITCTPEFYFLCEHPSFIFSGSHGWWRQRYWLEVLVLGVWCRRVSAGSWVKHWQANPHWWITLPACNLLYKELLQSIVVNVVCHWPIHLTTGCWLW